MVNLSSWGKHMNVYECLENRRTIRRFKSVPVKEETLTKILNAARWAPSSRNQQPWHLIIIRAKETLNHIGKISSSGSFIANAPLAIAIVMKQADQPYMDAGRAIQQMEVIAWAEGLGTCFVTLSNEEQTQIAKLLEIPQSLDLISVLPFGYRYNYTENKGILRKPLSEIIHTEKYLHTN